MLDTLVLFLHVFILSHSIITIAIRFSAPECSRGLVGEDPGNKAACHKLQTLLKTTSINIEHIIVITKQWTS